MSVKSNSDCYGVVLFFVSVLSGCYSKPVDKNISADAPQQSLQVVPAAPIPTLALPPVSPAPRAVQRTQKVAGIKNNRYSVAVQRLPVADVLFALAQDTTLELEIIGELDSQVTLNAINQPLDVILRKIAAQAAIRYAIQGDTLVVEADVPFIQTYRVDYLNIERASQTSVDLSTQVGSIQNTTDSSVSNSASNGSKMRIENQSENRFWGTLISNIGGILGVGGDDVAGTVFTSAEAGLITVRADSRQHELIAQLIDRSVSSARRQVLIEATVVEVTLNDSYESGIDWSILDNNGGTALEYAQLLGGLPAARDAATSPDALLTYTDSNSFGDVTATLRLLQQFGDVQVLSSPKIIAMNNQPAVLKVIDNRIYFTFDVNQQQRDNGDLQTQIDSQLHSVPVGLVMNVTAFVSADDEVVLNVRPTISRILNFAEDPSPVLAGQTQIKNLIPEIQVREMESMLRVGSGQVAIIGGLMQNRTDSRSSGLPGVARIPVLGRLFSRDTNAVEKTELLVFLRPTVIRQSQFQRHAEHLQRFMPVLPEQLLQSQVR
ncbi:MAG: pilus (MSHA type) biogenesis protein MshL [Pseudomonadota bacterium]